MAAPLHFGPHRLGLTLTYEVDLNTVAGDDAPLGGSESLAVAIWPLDGGATLAEPVATVVSGRARFEVVGDPAVFRPTVYRVSFTVDGRPALPVDAYLTFYAEAAAGESIGATKTLDSGISPYCTVAGFLDFYDVRHVGQLANDDGLVSDANDLEFSLKLERLLMASSGRLEAAVMAGRRYSVADLRLQAASASNAAAYLADLVANLTMAALRRRRGVPEDLTPAEKAAEETIQQLRDGARIMPFSEAATAGLPSSTVLSTQDKLDQNLVSNEVRYFGRRQWSRRFRGQ